MMPLIKHDRVAFEFARASALRSTDELINQPQAQLRNERAQHAFNCSEYEKQIAGLLRELAVLRLELGRRDRLEAFAAAPSPSLSGD